MNVLLIQPPFTIPRSDVKKCHPPLGLAYLAAALKRNHRVYVMDALAEGYNEQEVVDRRFLRYGLTFENIKNRIKNFKPDVVGISCLFSSQSENAQMVSSLAKEIDDGIITVLGGTHPSSVPQEVLKDKKVDFVVIGEGDLVLPRLLDFLEKGKDIRDINGIGFKQDGNIRINNGHETVEDLDKLPFPDWEIFPLEKYFKINSPHGGSAKRVPFLPVLTSRGCPFDCVFCSVHNLWGRNYRKRSSFNVLSELQHLINKFGVKEILFEDENLTLDKERAASIFKGLIERKLNLSWSTPNGLALQTLDAGTLKLMKDSGCHSISIGIESGDESVLRDIIKKPIQLSMVKPIIQKAKELGLEVAVFLIVGFPQEKRSQVEKTFRLAESLKADNINLLFANPLPGTELLAFCKEKGLIKDSFDYKGFGYDYPAFDLEDFPAKDLANAVALERLKLYILYFCREPVSVIRKICRKLLKDPGYFSRFATKFFR